MLKNFIENPLKVLMENLNELNKTDYSQSEDDETEENENKGRRASSRLDKLTKHHNEIEQLNQKFNQKHGAKDPKVYQKKDKIQELILIQKLKHEKRIKALEKLARFEKIQAQKLKKIMQFNENDSFSALIYDSFFNKNNCTSLLEMNRAPSPLATKNNYKQKDLF